MTDWLWPLLGGLLTAAAAGPLGSLLLWRRMAYFGDSLAHASLLGVAVAHGADTWLAIMAYAGLSLALVLTAALGDDGHGHSLEDYLFGNLLNLTGTQLLATSGGLMLVMLVLARYWSGLVALAIHEDTAQVDGWPVQRLRPLLMLLLAGVVAAGAKIMGVLLISALLVIPAAAARFIARSPGEMALRASAIGMFSVAVGVGIGLPAQLPLAPMIVLGSLSALLALMLWQRLRA